jgi:hypothetical protein
MANKPLPANTQSGAPLPEEGIKKEKVNIYNNNT